MPATHNPIKVCANTFPPTMLIFEYGVTASRSNVPCTLSLVIEIPDRFKTTKIISNETIAEA